MTKENFRKLLNSVTIREVSAGKHWQSGVLLENIDKEQISDIFVTIDKHQDVLTDVEKHAED